MRLCRRFGIDNSMREKHGALLDSEILADVYLELIGGKQPDFALEQGRDHVCPAPQTGARARAPHRYGRGSRNEESRRMPPLSKSLGRTRSGLKARPRLKGFEPSGVGRLLRGRALRQLLTVEREEIDLVEVQRRETTVPGDVGHDAAHEREQHPWAFDQKIRMQLLLRHVFDLEDAAILKLQQEDRFGGIALRLAVDLQLHDDVVWPFGLTLAGVEGDLHLDVGLGLALKRLCAATFSKDMSRMNCPRTCMRGSSAWGPALVLHRSHWPRRHIAPPFVSDIFFSI
jgi:hypothetical protein